MTLKQLPIHSISALEEFAKQLEAVLPAQGIVLLSGDLGSGKSTLARALIRRRADNNTLDVPSPTFTLVQNYETPKGTISHFDLYRLKSSDDIFDLGFEDAIAENLVLIEWPEKLGTYRPKNAASITIRGPLNDEGHRIIELDLPW